MRFVAFVLKDLVSGQTGIQLHITIISERGHLGIKRELSENEKINLIGISDFYIPMRFLYP